MGNSNNVPEVFQRTAKLHASASQPTSLVAHALIGTHLATRDARTQGVLADRDLFIDELIRKVIPATGHGADKDRDILRGSIV